MPKNQPENQQSAHHESTAKGPDGRMVDRMLFFSDAVFAIVLTIMVLELHPPVMEGWEHTSDSAIWNSFGALFRTFFAYLVSFALVGMWWAIHMRVTRALHRFDWPTAIANLFFLLAVSLIPFAASVLGESITSGVPWQIYWGVNALASLAMTIMMVIVSRNGGQLLGGMTGRERAARIVQSMGPGIGFAIGVWLAASGQVALSRYCWIFIIPVMVLARIIHKAPKSA